MSKLMFAFVLVCSAVMYNPEGLRDFAKQHASDITWEVKYTLHAIDRMLPSFMRFGRG